MKVQREKGERELETWRKMNYLYGKQTERDTKATAVERFGRWHLSLLSSLSLSLSLSPLSLSVGLIAK